MTDSTPPVTLETRVKALEAKVGLDATDAWSWVKTHWAHFITWILVAIPWLAKL
jgi:hypothetical protein